MVSVHHTTCNVPHGGLGWCQCTIPPTMSHNHLHCPTWGLGWCQCNTPLTISHMGVYNGVSAPHHLQCPTWGLRMVSVHHTTYNVPHGGLGWCQCTTPLTMSHKHSVQRKLLLLSMSHQIICLTKKSYNCCTV